ncbi:MULTISPECIES: YciI family protein [Thermomonosporaceae]|uniref:YciI family protein n=1 Tax=Thermomonosporaceae TaxID=2012 RepID=UPI00255A7B0F|nr:MULTISPECIES: YciI family protein [Thermomonosporaceae]MDL4776841.1 YciI family protein [Actinomadura xylanilytica]
MKFLLIMHTNPLVWDALTEAERNEVMTGHGAFMETVEASGEMISTAALAEPSASAVVRVRDGVPAVTDGPYLEAKEYVGGYYLVECENRERALELAALIPDAGVEGLGIEVRPVLFAAAAGG